MLKTVAENGDDLIIHDTSDWTFDVVPKSDAKLLLQYGVEVKGLSLSNNNLVVSDEFFLELPNNDSDDDDYYDFEDDEEESDEDFEDEDEEESEDDYLDEDDLNDDEEDDYDVSEEDFFDEDDEDEDESTVSKLYAYLSSEQIKMLKRYYLWYSQRIFTDAQKDPTLGMKSKSALQRKKKNLDTLRNTGGLWHYAGFIDMGYKGAGECTLGHPLRYMHLAWDVTVSDIETAFFGENYNEDFEQALESNNCIVFGIKCISDFFEVDKECMRSLQKAQRESLKDMALMYDYYANNMVNEVNSTFTVLDELVNKIKGIDAKGLLLDANYDSLVSPNLTAFYLQFRELNMIPPKSLIQEIRDNICDWGTHKFIYDRSLHYPYLILHQPTIEIMSNRVQRIFGKLKTQKFIEFYKTFNIRYASYSSIQSKIYNYFSAYFMYEICGWYKYNGESNKDEGGSNKLMLELYNNLYSSFRNFFTDIEFSLSYALKMFQLFDLLTAYVERDDRLKVVSVDTSDDSNWIVNDKDLVYNSAFINQYSEEKGVGFLDAVDFYKQIHWGRSNRYLGRKSIDEMINILSDKKNTIDANLGKFRQFVYDEVSKQCVEHNKKIAEELERKRLEEEEKRKERQKLEDEKNKQVVENTTNEVSSSKELIDYLSKVDLNSLTDSNSSFAKKILDTVTSSGKEPSSKQFYYLKQLYEKVSGVKYKGVDVEVNKESLSSHPDLEEALTYLVEHKDLVKDSRTYDIICSIVKYGKISERQMKYALEGKQIYENRSN